MAARRWGFDIGAAVLAIAFLLLASSHIAASGDDRRLDALAYALIVIAGTTVGLCRRWPAASVAIVTAVLGTYLLRQYVGGPVYVTGWIALFFLSWRTNRRTAITGAVVLCSVLFIVGIAVNGGVTAIQLVFVGWSAAAVFLGEALRSRRSYLVELEERNRSLERSRPQIAKIL